MEMPKPQAEHAKLAQLAGTWEGEETISDSPWGPGGKAFGRYTMRSDLDGFFVIQDYVEEKDGKVSFRGHGVFGFDPHSKQYTWYWVDSMGGPGDPARGSWNGDTMIFTSKNPQNEGRYTWRFEGPDRLHFKLENKFPGMPDFATMMSGDYRRTKKG